MKQIISKTLQKQDGAAIVVAVMILALLTIGGIAATNMSVTELESVTNEQVYKQAYYAAEAGLNEAMARGSLVSSATGYIGETGGTTSSWQMNILPSGTASGSDEVDSLQSTLNYTVNIRYKIEDAYFNNGTDNDEVVLYGQDYNYGSSAPAIGLQPVLVITSVGSDGNFGQRTIVAEVTSTTPVSVPGAMYSEGPLKVQSFIDGNDYCGTLDLPGVALAPTASLTTIGGSTILGVPPTDLVADEDIQSMIDTLKVNASYSYPAGTGTLTNQTWGGPPSVGGDAPALSCASFEIVYFESDTKISGGSQGCGIMLVDGDLEIQGGFQWYGVIIVRDEVKFTGSGGTTKNISGGMLSGSVADLSTISGGTEIYNCSSAISDSMNSTTRKILLSYMEQ